MAAVLKHAISLAMTLLLIFGTQNAYAKSELKSQVRTEKAHWYLLRSFIHLGRMPEADSEARWLLNKHHNDYLLLKYFCYRRKPPQADAWLWKQLEKYPDDYALHNFYGAFLLNTMRLPEVADLHFEKAEQLAPNKKAFEQSFVEALLAHRPVFNHEEIYKRLKSDLIRSDHLLKQLQYRREMERYRRSKEVITTP